MNCACVRACVYNVKFFPNVIKIIFKVSKNQLINTMLVSRNTI